MPALLRRLTQQFTAPAWGPALAGSIGCALPLLLGFFSGHAGFYWATIGAFAASLADPRRRLGMQAMLVLALAGAGSTALGFWAGQAPLSSLLTFASLGLLLAAARRLGEQVSKLAFVLALCFCLGAGQFGRGSFDNPAAIATLFLLGALGVTLLGFGLRGLHGLRMWPSQPPMPTLRRFVRHQAPQLSSINVWLWFGSHIAALALAGLLASTLNFPQSHWLTLATLALVVSGLPTAWPLLVLRSGVLVLAAAALIFAGYSLAGTSLMLMLGLGMIFLIRLFQARPPTLFLLQNGLGFVLLAESLSIWSEPQWRLVNAAIGASLGLLVLAATWLGRHFLKRNRTNGRHASHTASAEQNAERR